MHSGGAASRQARGPLPGRRRVRPIPFLCLSTFESAGLYSCSPTRRAARGRGGSTVSAAQGNSSNFGDLRGGGAGQGPLLLPLGVRGGQGGLRDKGLFRTKNKTKHSGLEQLEVLSINLEQLGRTSMTRGRPSADTAWAAGRGQAGGPAAGPTASRGPHAWALRWEDRASHRRHLTFSSSHATLVNRNQ